MSYEGRPPEKRSPIRGGEGLVTGDCSEQAAPEQPVLDADRASWLQNDLRAFAELATMLSIMKRGGPSAYHEMYESALQGAIRGQAREICRTLGFKPGVNLEPYIDLERKRML